MSRFFICGQTRREYLLSDFHQTRVAKTYWARQEQHEQFICLEARQLGPLGHQERSERH